VVRTGSSTRVSSEWEKLLCELPGYDPYRGAAAFRFDAECAQRWIDFFQHPKDGCLRHIEGAVAGERFTLERWQQAFIANLFGWKRSDGTRRYREAFLFVPRKNGKTPMAAGICIGVLAMDDEPGAQVYSAAAETEQAALLYRHAKGMVEQEPALIGRMRPYGGIAQRSIVLRSDPASVYRVLNSEAGSKHGYNSHLVIVDELHAHPDRELVDVLQTSLASKNRRQPLMIYITTSDYEREDSICNEKHEYACGVRDGTIDDPGFLPAIWEASRTDDWTSPKVWARVNPNLGVSVDEDYLSRECKKAKASPAYENTFKRLHLNIRTEQAERFFGIDVWDACNKGSIHDADLIGRPCYAGLDLGATSDVTAMVLLFPNDDGSYVVVPRFWMPDAARLKDKNKNYRLWSEWHDAGLVTLTEGNVTDYNVVRRDVNALADRGFAIEEMAVDRLFQGAQLCTDLGGDGFTVISFGQGFLSMAAPTKEFLELLLDGKLIHDGNPIMRWMASNVMVETDAAGNWKPSKKKSKQKIDGIVALIMALGRAMVREDVSDVALVVV
jgi:phage terminase large subunit-like protein